MIEPVCAVYGSSQGTVWLCGLHCFADGAVEAGIYSSTIIRGSMVLTHAVLGETRRRRGGPWRRVCVQAHQQTRTGGPGLSGSERGPEPRRTTAQQVVFGRGGFRLSRSADGYNAKGGGAGKENLGGPPRGWSRPSPHVSNRRCILYEPSGEGAFALTHGPCPLAGTLPSSPENAGRSASGRRGEKRSSRKPKALRRAGAWDRDSAKEFASGLG
jgi:hypothetical protein